MDGNSMSILTHHVILHVRETCSMGELQQYRMSKASSQAYSYSFQNPTCIFLCMVLCKNAILCTSSFPFYYQPSLLSEKRCIHFSSPALFYLVRCYQLCKTLSEPILIFQPASSLAVCSPAQKATVVLSLCDSMTVFVCTDLKKSCSSSCHSTDRNMMREVFCGFPDWKVTYSLQY